MSESLNKFEWVQNLPNRAGTGLISAREIAALLKRPEPTAEQIEIIEAPPGAMLVVAGAGSGKTETMTNRAIWLIANEIVTPSEVLGLTFSVKAASELKERLIKRLFELGEAMQAKGLRVPTSLALGGDELLGMSVTVTTYNSFASEFVKENALRIGREPNLRVLSSAGAWQIAYEIAKSAKGIKPFTSQTKAVANGIISFSSTLQEHSVTVKEQRSYLESMKTKILSFPPASTRANALAIPTKSQEILDVIERQLALLPMVEEYEQQKHAQAVIDFPDQLALATTIARQSPAAVESVRNQYQVVMLDEFQDTSVVQLELMKRLFGIEDEEFRITLAVGDPKQSIYAWRGASAASLDAFHKNFSAAKPVTKKHLATSWRNDQAILDIANVIGKDLDAEVELKKSPLADEGEVEFSPQLSEDEEIQAVVQWVKKEREAGARVIEGEKKYPSCAIILRKRVRMPAYQKALAELAIPSITSKSNNLFYEPEVADVIAVLQLLADANSSEALLRLLDGPRFKLGLSDLGVMGEYRKQLARYSAGVADDSPQITLLEVIENPPPQGFTDSLGRSISAEGMARIKDFQATWKQITSQKQLALPDLVSWIARSLGVDLALMSNPAVDPKWATRNLEAFREFAESYLTDNPNAQIQDFLDYLEITLEKDDSPSAGLPQLESDEVVITTVHAAKGLEWDLVAVAGLSESNFPLYRNTRSTKEDEHGNKLITSSGWLSEVKDSKISYALRGDNEELPKFSWDDPLVDSHKELVNNLDDFKLQEGERLIKEERRLFYVAVTRARHKLHLSGSLWLKGRSTDVKFSRFFKEVIELNSFEKEKMLEVRAAVNSYDPIVEDQQETIWPSAPNPRAKTVMALKKHFESEPSKALETQNAKLETLKLSAEHLIAHSNSKAEITDAALPLTLSPSSIVQMVLDQNSSHNKAASNDQTISPSRPGMDAKILRPMPRRPSKEAHLGTKFHSWVEESLLYGTALDISDAELYPYDEGSRNLEIIQKLQERFLSSAFSNATALAVEIPVALVLENAYIPGFIDAVYASAAFEKPSAAENTPGTSPEGHEDDGIVIVDWKTGNVPSGKELEAKALQLSIYRLAWHQQFKVPLEKIRTIFYYVAKDKIIEITDHISEAELTEMYQDLTAPENS